ncbi:hypothetical protein [Kitasatospora sp. GP82]|uniref:hypothetical protein n=1 Tax=Kitasatospora sp. GP82 TaxID=3035089 RepID=UPI002476D6B8|nr:hypothetical protein [Kitasatospora sp. GP82]MDH6130311.1 hypothetical protein [Kitasatospora sp. GP82]
MVLKRLALPATLNDDVPWRAVGCHQTPEHVDLIQGAAAAEQFHVRALAGSTADPVRCLVTVLHNNGSEVTLPTLMLL